MEFLDLVYFGNSLRIWLIAAGLFIVVLLALRTIRGIIERRLRKLVERSTNQLDDLALDLVSRTGFFFPFVIALYVAVQPLVLPPTGDRVFRGVIVIGTLLQAALWGNAVISFWITRFMQERMDEDAAAATSIGALRFVGKLILWSVVLLLALDNLGFDITTLVTGLGISGIAVALAVQNILSDLFASLSIVLDKPFVIGDFIIVGDFLGTVEHVGLKTTRLRSLTGEQLVFSNSDLLNSRIRNYKRMKERRVVFTFGVTYQTPHQQLQAIPVMVREIIESQENARFGRAHFNRFGASSLDFEVVYFVAVPDHDVYMDIQQTINLALYQRLEEQGIEFAYPTQTVYLRSEDADAS